MARHPPSPGVHHPPARAVTHDVDGAVLQTDRILVLTDGRASLDVTVGSDAPRLRSDPQFDALRSRLLAALGVDEVTGCLTVREEPDPESDRTHPPQRTGDSHHGHH